MEKLKILSISLVFYGLTGFGISLTILANVGVSSFNALNLSLAQLTFLKVGTVTTLMNCLFLVVYIWLTKGKLWQKYLIQLISVLSLGQVINFFTYQIFATVALTSYFLRIGLFLLGVLIAGIGTGMVLNLKVLAFPIESVCQFLGEAWSIPFQYLRYSVDIIFVSSSVGMTFLLGGPLFIREGTVISLLLLSWAISQTKKQYEGWLNKWQLAQRQGSCLTDVKSEIE